MKIKQLFGIKTDQPTTAKVLGENLSSLFGAEEGTALEVQVTEEMAAAIDEAEGGLSIVNGTLEENQNELTAAQATIQSLQASVQGKDERIAELQTEADKVAGLEEAVSAKDARIAELEKLPGATTTHTVKAGDDVDASADNVSEIRQLEIAEQQKGMKYHKSKN